MKAWFILALPLLTLVGCTPRVEPISYGTDPCAHCKMIITDARYGSELVTAKGKRYKFDSVECLIDYLLENETEIHSLWLTSFTHPSKLVPADSCFILKSEAMPSPMGRYLTAFGNSDSVLAYQFNHGGSVLHWKEAQIRF
ncbi:nitrous oxide reductase accessory protein NosL [bacterium SCSIO 12741]|nr:nitrous oxide reductase accessory protein NosL [bacterium SCSIO 12741]